MYGMVTHQFGEYGPKHYTSKMVELGAGFARVDFNWNDIEPNEKGSYRTNLLKELDVWVNQADREGITLFATLAYTPGWANGYRDRAVPPTNMKDWYDFVYFMAERYKGRIRHWGIWNEPNLEEFLKTDDQIDTYFALSRWGRNAVKAADPNSLVLGPETSHHALEGLFGRGLTFYERVMKRAFYWDIITVHWYPDSDDTLRTYMRKVISKSRGKEVWLTEVGIDHCPMENQADVFTDALWTFLSPLQTYWKKIFFYDLWKDFQGCGPSVWAIVNEDWTNKPAFTTYQKWIRNRPYPYLSMTTTTTGPAPPTGFVAGTPALYYNVQKGGRLPEPVEVCFSYADVEFMHPAKAHLFHYDGTWKDITVSNDVTDRYICGETAYFSPFAIFEEPNQPPVAKCKGVTLVAGPTCSAGAAAEALDDGSWDPDGDAITFSLAPSGPFPLGATQVTLTVTDSVGDSDTCQATVTVVDETPPTITCPADKRQVNDPGACSAFVDPGVASAEDNCPGVSVSGVRSDGGGALIGSYPVGTTEIFWTAQDSSGNQAACTQRVTVVDVEPPTIDDLSADPSILWPPNRKLVDVTVGYYAADNCDNPPNCWLDVTCNESGGRKPAWIVVNSHHVKLRAEREGRGDGRVYGNIVTCEDTAGNQTNGITLVTVPHDQRDRP